MCCTRKTAAGKSRVKPGAMRITVAGPPVEAPRTTTGKRWSVTGAEGGDGSRRIVRRVELCRHRLESGRRDVKRCELRELWLPCALCAGVFFHALHVQIDAAGRLGDEFDGAEFEGIQRSRSAFAGFRADNDDGARVGGHDLRGGLKSVDVGHVDVHGDDVRLQGFGQSDGFAAVFCVTDDLKRSSALKMVSRTLHMKAESSTTSTRNFFCAWSPCSSTLPARPGVPPPFP